MGLVVAARLSRKYLLLLSGHGCFHLHVDSEEYIFQEWNAYCKYSCGFRNGSCLFPSSFMIGYDFYFVQIEPVKLTRA